jgi:UPF0755 protein
MEGDDIHRFCTSKGHRITDQEGDIKTISIKIVSITIIIFVLAGVGVGFYYWQRVSKVVSNDSTKTVFDIAEGESTFDIAQGLEDEGFIRSAWYFATLVKYQRKTLQAGSYLLSPSMKVSEIIRKISTGDTSLIKITTLEGWRVEQIARYLDGKGSIIYANFLAAASGMEGELFPDTFYITTETSADAVAKLMYDDYLSRTGGLNVSGDDLILASIVERETTNDSEKEAIAGVYENRLKIGMKLEADPTVIYGHDSAEIKELSFSQVFDYKYWGSITKNDYNNPDNLYNTYIYSGLPPGPICNPGLESIKAVLNYQKHGYYYFFHDAEGEIHFSKTLSEHESTIANYGLAE